MAKWGALWGLGAPWGIEPLAGPGEVCVLAQDRVLVQMDDSPGNRKFRDLVCDFVFDAGVFGDIAEQVKGAFDLDVAQGVQLDAIGSLVGLPRQGFDDNDYRRFLNIQVDLLLSATRDAAEWTGTLPNILTIARTFVGSGNPNPIILTQLPPYSFLLTITGITVAEAEILVGFIAKAIYAGVIGQTIVPLAAGSLWDSDSVGPIPDGGVWGSDSVAVIPSAVWGVAIAV